MVPSLRKETPNPFKNVLPGIKTCPNLQIRNLLYCCLDLEEQIQKRIHVIVQGHW